MVFKNAEVFIEGNFKHIDFEVKNGSFISIGNNINSDEIIDCTNKLIIPGLIDIHSHGCVGYDFITASVSEIEKMCLHYLENGVTSILATSMTIDLDIYKKAMVTIKDAIESDNKGSRILGINMEGPFLGVDKKGAHDERYLLPIDTDIYEELNTLSGNHIMLIDIDPTLENSFKFIEKYSKDKVISLAHTRCDYDTAIAAIQAGASHVTHLFNAMNGLHHRNPGIIGAVSDYPVFAELICDGVHIHPSVIRMMFKIAPDKMVLISDSMSAAGLDDGVYELGGQKVNVKGNKATLQNGTIAGSTTNVYDALKKAISFGVKKEDAILSATYYPAKAIKFDHLIGSISVGKKADFIILNQNFDIENVYKDGISANLKK